MRSLLLAICAAAAFSIWTSSVRADMHVPQSQPIEVESRR